MTSRASQGSKGAASGQERIAYHRHAGEMVRARQVTIAGWVITVAINVALDLLVFPGLGRGSLGSLIAVQAAILVMQAAPMTLMFRDPLPPEREVVPLGAVVFVLTAIGSTYVGMRLGGVTSPVPVGAVAAVLMVQVMALPRPWRTGAVVTTATALAYPLTILVMRGGDALVRAQLAAAEGRAYFAGALVMLAALVVLAAWGGHVIWALRQSAFESKSIGRYRLLRRIGKGGMGEVWRAHDRALRRDVALKLLSADHKNDPDRVARFEREIEATAALDHPNTIRIHDWGVTHDGVWYYAMELLDGADLSTLVKRHGALPPPLVAVLGLQAARALAEAHAAGIIHRDIKPANLFAVGVEGVVDHLKVLDFGVARIDTEAGDLTLAGAVVGTPGYLAPEVTAGVTATAATDVWSLAATLFYAATGTTWPPPAPPDLPSAFEALLRRGLDPDPARRPFDGAAFADALAATGLAAAWTGTLPIDPDTVLLPTGADGMDTMGHENTVRARPRGDL